MLEISDVNNRWREAGRPGLGALNDGWFETYVTNPMDYAATYYGILEKPPPPPKKFPSVFVEQAKPEPTDRVAVAPATINTAYLYAPGHDPESVAENKQFVDSRKNIFEAISWPKSLTVGSGESVDLLNAYYAGLARQRATGEAVPTSKSTKDVAKKGSTSDKKTGDWQQYVPWGVVGVLGLTVLIVALRR